MPHKAEALLDLQALHIYTLKGSRYLRELATSRPTGSLLKFNTYFQLLWENFPQN
jgi:hypothetical protein